MFSSNATQVSDAAFIEDVFSTFLYTGNGDTQTITNGIDLAGKGGLVWAKVRVSGTGNERHYLYDTVRGVSNAIFTDLASGQVNQPSDGVTSFSATGFSVGSMRLSGSGFPYVSWTFREQPKFFDVVTYTGNGANRTIAHNLGSVPGCIIVKQLSGSNQWEVYHRSMTAFGYLSLNNTTAVQYNSDRWNNTEPTITQFSLGTNGAVNGSGQTYIAYLFAHNAGGFGATGADNVITCDKYMGNGSSAGPEISLGWEPQWLLIKRADGAGNWNVIDNMRGFTVSGNDAVLNPNLSNAESSGNFVTPTATGFNIVTTDAAYNSSGQDYIYIAIRRGPMRTPTSGTSVFQPQTYTGNSSTQTLNNFGFPPDAVLLKNRSSTASTGSYIIDKLRGGDALLNTPTTAAELVGFGTTTFNQDGISLPALANTNGSGTTYIDWSFRRAPGFFDVVCWTGDGSVNRAITHNLSVPPELLICKSRTVTNTFWRVLWTGSLTSSFNLNTNGANSPGNAPYYFGDGSLSGPATAPTSTNFYVANEINQSGQSIVGYLFASCPGVSKVGSFTGTGATQVINCGFSAGARFILIKRTDSTGDWYVWDSARGIVAGNDPYLALNSTAAEVTNTDWVDTAASGFELSNAGGNDVNINGASYIFLAIA